MMPDTVFQLCHAWKLPIEFDEASSKAVDKADLAKRLGHQVG